MYHSIDKIGSSSSKSTYKQHKL